MRCINLIPDSLRQQAKMQGGGKTGSDLADLVAALEEFRRHRATDNESAGATQAARCGLGWADTRTMAHTPCAEDGINAQVFAVTCSQVGTFEPTTIGTTSAGICLLLPWSLTALTRSESAWVVRGVILDAERTYGRNHRATAMTLSSQGVGRSGQARHWLSVATPRRFLMFAAFCSKRQRRRGDGSTIMFTRRLTPRDANKQYPRQSENSCTGNAGSNRFLVCRLNETHGCSNLTTRAAIASLAKFDFRNRSCFRRRSSGYCCHGQLILIGATDHTLQEHLMARRRISDVATCRPLFYLT